jgi:hypothetical protein
MYVEMAPAIVRARLKAGIKRFKRREYNCKRYRDNAEKQKARSRDYCGRHPEKRIARSKKWCSLHPEYYRERYQNDPEKYRDKMRNWILNNPEKSKKYARNWRKNNPNKAREGPRKAYETARLNCLMFLGERCYVNTCQSNNDPKELRFKGLEIHELNGAQRDKNGKRKGPLYLYKAILEGTVKKNDINLLCGYHHAIADALGKKKWLELLMVLNSGARLNETRGFLNGQSMPNN